jgi:hypothetical protein
MTGAMYDEAALSAEFKVLAAKADDQLHEAAQPSGPSNGLDRDEALARSCVYGYLYDRHFLQSPEKLLNELHWLKQTSRPRAPRHAPSAERFQDFRDRLLDALIDRFAGNEPGMPDG